jgi:hypothetical protein
VTRCCSAQIPPPLPHDLCVWPQPGRYAGTPGTVADRSAPDRCPSRTWDWPARCPETRRHATQPPASNLRPETPRTKPERDDPRSSGPFGAWHGELALGVSSPSLCVSEAELDAPGQRE